jgi:hypothetical protein
MNNQIEKRLLQAAMTIACIVPLTGGLLGMAFGARMLDHGGDVTVDSHMRYLSGLLLGVRLRSTSAIPSIENQGTRMTLLTVIVLIGGLARLYDVVIDGWPASTMIFALGMELVVTPLLWFWQRHLENVWDAEPQSAD